MKKITILSLVTILFSMYSCDNDDLNVIADYKEIPSVYCLLNQENDVHYVKVGKAFLGELSAEEMAQVSDSLIYQDAKVWLEGRTGNNTVAKYDFIKVDTIKKPEGYFANDKNPIYVHIGKINPDLDYQIFVEVPSKGIVAKANEPVKLITSASIIDPTSSRRIGLTGHNNGGKIGVEYRSAANGDIYEMVMNFYYIEVNNETKDTTWDLPPISYALTADKGVTPGTDIKKEFDIKSFYDLLTANIKAKEGYTRLVRYPNSVEFILRSGDENFKIYSDITAPSDGIIQEKPFWTNIVATENGEPTNAIGLFAARHEIHKFNKVTFQTIDTLHSSNLTKHLNFESKASAYYLETK